MSKRLPPLYALRAFESAARIGSFTLAADELNLTQSAVSKHIKTLEEFFSCQLFTRIGPRVKVTPQGEIFASELKHIFKRLQDACDAFKSQENTLRLKAPSTLTMRWLLDCLSEHKKTSPQFNIQTTSVWMDIDTVDFFSEPYDCAILLGQGSFGHGTKSIKLFDEWLVPVCSSILFKSDGEMKISEYELIHPSPDRRDWRRWLQRANIAEDIDITQGKVFDSLEQGSAAAAAGHGIAIGDLVLCMNALNNKQLILPVNKAVKTGDGYYMVYPSFNKKEHYINQLCIFLKSSVPNINDNNVIFID